MASKDFWKWDDSPAVHAHARLISREMGITIDLPADYDPIADVMLLNEDWFLPLVRQEIERGIPLDVDLS